MAARKRTPAKRPGKNIENWQRHTVQILLRLRPEVASTLRARAEEAGLSLAEYVTTLVR